MVVEQTIGMAVPIVLLDSVGQDGQKLVAIQVGKKNSPTTISSGSDMV